jgi:hypothetical protein
MTMKFSVVHGQSTTDSDSSDTNDTNTPDAFSNRRLHVLRRQQPRKIWNDNNYQDMQFPAMSTTKNIREAYCDNDRGELYVRHDISYTGLSALSVWDTAKRSEVMIPLHQRYRRHAHRRRRRLKASYPKNINALQKTQHIIYMVLFLTILIMNVSFLYLHRNYYGATTKIVQDGKRELSGRIHPLSHWLSQQQSSQSGMKHSASKGDIKHHTSVQRGITYYSRGRRDRSGAVVHDMLWVHAYAFSQNGTYGGACGGLSSNETDFVSLTPKIMAYQNVTQELINQLHWNLGLKYACPTNFTNSTAEVIVERAFYLNLDASIFTPQWKKYFQQQVSAAASLASLVSSSSSHRHNEPFDDTTTKREKVLQRAVQQGTVISDKYVRLRSNTTINEIYDNTVYTIAVHIRRGDVDPCTYMNRYLSNNYYLRLIKKYYKQVPFQYKTVNVNIYSESSSYESFDVFQNVYKYNLHLDDTLYNVWSALSTANVAILSKSSFSYVPAIINPNTVVYTSYRHLPLPSWDVVERNVSDQEKRVVKNIHDKECKTINVK